MATLRERINGISGFREKMEGNANEGKMCTLYEWLCQAVGSLEHYGQRLLETPRDAAKATTFMMRQIAMVSELLEPLEDIMQDKLKVEDFINSRIGMYQRIILIMGPTFSNTNMGDVIFEIQEQNVQRNILNLLTAR